MDKQTIQWILSAIAFPLIALVGWTGIDNKTDIAVLSTKFEGYHKLLIQLDEKMDTNNNMLIRAVTKLESLENSDSNE